MRSRGAATRAGSIILSFLSLLCCFFSIVLSLVAAFISFEFAFQKNAAMLTTLAMLFDSFVH